MPEEASVQEVCTALATARSDAALLTGPSGEMTGIVTAIDLTRCAVQQQVTSRCTRHGQ